MTAQVLWGARSDVGCVRENNEDALLASPPMFVVADGMGGHAAGEVASRMAVQRLADIAGTEAVDPRSITIAVENANAEIVARATHDPNTAGMGTTVSGVCLGAIAGSPHWFVFNVGDSRTYRFVDGVLTQVTVDHSEVAERVAAGALSRHEARIHPMRNVVTRSLGSLPAPVVDVWVLPAEPGDTFIVCSDGLVNEVEDAVIARIASSRDTPQGVADALVSEAIDCGARDNVTVVVVALTLDRSAAEPSTAVTAPRAQIVSVEHG